ncbi:MAG: hypothetical protein HY901_03390 [Deltaproteobacteria bacterium]|nr:hypothetical protein [Deltaproteobacteria bacterium]
MKRFASPVAAMVVLSVSVAGCNCGEAVSPVSDAAASATDGSTSPADSGSNPGFDGGPMCKGAGATCVAASDCCSGSCPTGTCVGGCLADGQTCSSSGACCSGSCSGGLCASVVMGDGGSTVCLGNGAGCLSAAECCSGHCDNGACVASDGPGLCDDLGASCTLARTCCSLNCVEGQCASGLCKQQGVACDSAAPETCCSHRCVGGVCEGPLGSTCKVAGEKCAGVGFTDTCCSKACADLDPGAGQDLRCAATGVCGANGEPCLVSTDCCSYSCNADGVCEQPPVGGECLVVGSACQALSNCCSGLCALDNSGFRLCQYLGGCHPEEELCRRETDCCAYNSAHKGTQPVCQIFDADAGVGRCRQLTGDAPAGEVCEGSRNNTCAPKNDEYCNESISGIKRCSGACDGGACSITATCQPAGAACTSPDECCTGICAPTAEIGFICAAACLPTGAACSTSSDCCNGYCALNGFCGGVQGVDAGFPVAVDAGGATSADAGEPGPGLDAGPAGDTGPAPCKPTGAVCADDSQCCTVYCDPAMKRCQSPIN